MKSSLPLRINPAALKAAAVVVLLAGCSTSPDQKPPATMPLTTAVGGQADLTEVRDMEAAVAWMLEHSPAMQALLAADELEQSSIHQQGRLANPSLTLARLKRGAETEIERGLQVDLLGWLSLPARMRLSDRELANSRLQARIRLLQQTLRVRLAWIEAVAAGQRARHAGDAERAAQAAHALALRMREAGTLSALDSGRETAFWLESGLSAQRSRDEARHAREKLALVMGVDDPGRLRLPERLPDLPESVPEDAGSEQALTASRLDILAARGQAHAVASALKLGKATRFVNVMELGLQSNSATGQPVQRGVEVSLELPLFDFGRTRVADAERRYRQALGVAAASVLQARSEYRLARADQAAARAAVIRYRDELIPLQKRLLDEVLLRYNGMLADTFEVLAQTREQIRTLNDGLDASERYWKAAAIAEHVRNAPLPSGDS